jgi:hypothetical protein
VLSRLRRHLTYANVVSSLCLFVLLGGTAFAAAKIGSAQIKNNSIQSKDIKNNQIAGKDVKNRSLTDTDFKAGTLLAGPTGPPGERGATGARGVTGATGSSAASMLTGRIKGSFDNLFFAPSGSSAGSSTESDMYTLSPATTVVARDFFARSGASPPHARQYHLRVNGSDTSLGCMIPGTASSCSDVTHAVTIPPGSYISIDYAFDETGGAGGPPDTVFGWRATTP